MDGIAPFFQCGLPLVLLIIGFVVGRAVEAHHFSSLKRREAILARIPVTDTKMMPPGVKGVHGVLVTGSVVIGSDYFKTFASGLRKIVGGELRSFERLMERARREAMCRVLEDAHRYGAAALINIRMETASIGRMSRSPMPMVEIVAYGTAIVEDQRS